MAPSANRTLTSRFRSVLSRRLTNIAGVTRLKVCVTPSCLRSSPRLDASTGNCFGCFSFVPTERLPCPSRLGEAVESKVYCWRPSRVFWRMRASLSLACAQAATLSTQVVGQPRSRTQVREFLFFWELLRQMSRWFLFAGFLFRGDPLYLTLFVYQCVRICPLRLCSSLRLDVTIPLAIL